MLFWKKKNDATETENSEEAGFQKPANKKPQGATNSGKSAKKVKSAKKPAKTSKSSSQGASSDYTIDKKLKERFLSNVKKEKNHWRWMGSFTDDGYGQMWVGENKVVKTHRLSFEIHKKRLANGQRLRNLCGDKQCINPSHWEIIEKKSAKAKPAKKAVAKKKTAAKKKTKR